MAPCHHPPCPKTAQTPPGPSGHVPQDLPAAVGAPVRGAGACAGRLAHAPTGPQVQAELLPCCLKAQQYPLLILRVVLALMTDQVRGACPAAAAAAAVDHLHAQLQLLHLSPGHAASNVTKPG
jgi:hypothetical protein